MPKVKVIKKNMTDPNMNEMFQQMIGGEGDPGIVREKIAKLKKYINQIGTLSDNFSKGPLFKKYSYDEWELDFSQFAGETKKLSDMIVTFDDDKELTQFYVKFKEENHLKRLMLLTSSLVDIESHLSIDDNWILDQPGLTFQPLEFTNFDLKLIYNNCTKSEIKYIITYLKCCFNICHNIWKTVTSPDVDVQKLSKIVVEAIDKIKNVPELNRCGRAFKKISESVGLLETNFDGYYKDMVSSKNPSSIMENFIVDISKDSNMDAKLLFQFRKIINYYKKQRNNNPNKNPQIDKLFSSLNEKMESFGLNNVKEEKDEDDTDE